MDRRDQARDDLVSALVVSTERRHPRVLGARLAKADWSAIVGYWLGIEVLSPSSHVYDREFKRDAYLALGVEQVWLVDCVERCVDICKTQGRSKRVRDSIRWRPPEGESVVITLSDVFAGLE